MKKKFYKWTIEVAVSADVVADGFNLNDDGAHNMVCEAYPFLLGHEVSTKVIKAPSVASIKKEQGY